MSQSIGWLGCHVQVNILQICTAECLPWTDLLTHQSMQPISRPSLDAMACEIVTSYADVAPICMLLRWYKAVPLV